MLKVTFFELFFRYSSHKDLAETYWSEIEKHYNQKGRHYHTLRHLENLLIQLESVKEKIQDWDTTLFTLYYHDIIYKATRKDNEEKSAELAAKRLREINYPDDKIELCITHIIATKSHTKSTNSDTNYFTDADLSILGADSETYKKYTDQVRKEYSIFPDFMYYPGRKKALKHFLEMASIFKTEEFKNRFEEQARKNITMEIKSNH
jgi:predicted metal-dependent HD superfamily phosphohydrolase